MKRIFVLLTDRMPSDFEENLTESDAVLVGHNLDFSHPKANVQKIGLPTENTQEQLAMQVVAGLSPKDKSAASKLMLALSNDLHSYVLRPLVAVIELTLPYLKKYPNAKLYIIHARRSSDNVPLAGFVTTESPRGSRSLLGSYIAGQLKKVPGISDRAEFLEVRGDIFCCEFLRSFLLRGLDLVLRIKFAASLIMLGIFRPGPLQDRGTPVDAIVLVRAFHQARYAKRICESAGQRIRLAVFVIPQFLQGGLFFTLNKLMPALAQCRSIYVSPRNVLAAVVQTRRDRKILEDYGESGFDLNLEIESVRVFLCVKGLACELSNLAILLMYRHLLASILKDWSIQRIVNFELVGRIAGLDRLGADDAGCELVTIQTAIISEVAHPVFPHAHRFFADGPQTAERLAMIGMLKRGTVEYAGSAVPIQPLRNPVFPKVLAFFTQPYEPDVTCLILSTLVEFCDTHGSRLLVKLHPRDETDYTKVLGVNDSPAQIVNGSADPADVLLQCDVCITRTSSVAKESLALGRPIILCLWSELDKSIRADYAENVAKFDHRTFRKNELIALLSNPHALAEIAEELRGRWFGELRMTDLVNRACFG